ncbi:type II toxin-antitoxin system RelE/ParE family toxin [Lichenibacterium ramalinae]|uniref:type II toxin-antitoxin system RelE/ParE family toxin n=1 Tax=Lichenibacterium ramalinae TaxID=2316527 RepID=UPI0013ECBD0F|nr:type II toxin-antitoxin system RelE/ParE family toxin [Lichenibacterium ramalinae]
MRPGATADIVGIARDLVERAGRPVADEYRLRFRAAFRRLASPESAAPRPALGQGVRLMAFKPYVILHRYDRPRATVFVLRVLHGRRRLAVDAP